MRITGKVIGEGAISVPAVVVQNDHPRGQVVVVHGYGGCKEEALGLAWRIAECGFDAVAIDLRGHGENPRPYDGCIFEDVQAAIGYCKAAGRVVAVGHSLGGRLCLLSQADYKIGISPALTKEYGQQTRNLITAMRSHRVREGHAGMNFDTVASLPVWNASDKERALLLYCTRDVTEIISACVEMEAKGVEVKRIDSALHGDVFLNEQAFAAIKQRLDQWFA